MYRFSRRNLHFTKGLNETIELFANESISRTGAWSEAMASIDVIPQLSKMSYFSCTKGKATISSNTILP